ncbi:MAG: S-layer homology domain-containing protein [Nostocaceae cyanobacterium]|nr:S-layer homology domain-containing protein [Nostocaceae cyanobacterium]
MPSQRPAILLLAVFLASLTACTNSPTAKNLEQSLAADSRLQSNPSVFSAPSPSPDNRPTPNKATDQLPGDFPQEIPLYPNAQLQPITSSTSTSNSALSSVHALSSDPSNLIASFYQKQFQTNNWRLQPSTNVSEGNLVAQRNDLQVKVSIQPKSVTGNANSTPNQPQTATEIVIQYGRNSSITATSSPKSDSPQISQPGNATISTNNDPHPISQPGEAQFIGPVPPSDFAKQPAPSVATANTSEFSDLDKAPSEFRQYIQNLAALGVLPLDSTAAKSVANTGFEPNKVITRSTYARWLVAANNAMNTNSPAKQIRLASDSAQPVFSDVPRTHPDFPVIQGLAEAGLIPSSLSGDATAVLFRPDAPLTREQLILWKVPLDTRTALPNATLDAVKQTWGFQDVGTIDSRAMRAVLADFQNGEQSNIRRVFGYTTLFQPKKTVTRAEAAAALWYFGTQGEGISAKDALKLKS